MKIAICDDNPEDVEIIKKELERIDQGLNNHLCIYCFTDAERMADNIIKENVDVVLLDISLPKKAGISIAAFLAQKFPFIKLIFLTNCEELVFQSIQYRPLRFVRKRFMLEELEEAVVAAEIEIAAEMHVIYSRNGCAENVYAIRDIVYIESSRHYIEVHMRDMVDRIRGKISDCEKVLEQYGFLRVHIGYLVNIQYIQKINTKGVLLINGQMLPVSRKNMVRVQRQFQDRLKHFVCGCYL